MCQDTDRSLAEGITALLDGLEGWCTPEKALAMADLAIARDVRIAVEIGVYAGRSLLPLALALRHKGSGVVYGIEIWSNEAATRFSQSAESDQWWAALDFARIKRMFLERLLTDDLLSQVRIVEAPSEQAHHLFSEIDFLHIDGGHSAIGAVLDVANFLPKLRPGGVLVFDDVDWDTTQPAVNLIERSGCCRALREFGTANGTVGCRIYERTG